MGGGASKAKNLNQGAVVGTFIYDGKSIEVKHTEEVSSRGRRKTRPSLG
jgi:hypothetical protein